MVKIMHEREGMKWSLRSLLTSESGRPVSSTTWILPLISSMLVWCSFFPLNISLLAWVSLVPVTLLIRTEQRPCMTLRWSYCWGFVGSVITLQWMRLGHPYMYLALLAMSAYLACYLPAFVMLTRLAVHRFRVPLVLAVPIVWTGLEFVRAHLLTGFPWYYLGHSQHRFIALIQICDLVGAYGVSFIVAMVNAAIAVAVPDVIIKRLQLARNDSKPTTLPYLGLALTILIFFGAVSYGTVRRKQAAFIKGPRVALIQGNIKKEVKHDPASASAIVRVHERLTHLAMRGGGPTPSLRRPDLVVWPETMFPWPVYEADEEMTTIELLQFKPQDAPIADHQWIDIFHSRATLKQIEQDAREQDVAMLIGVPHVRRTKVDEQRHNSVVLVTPHLGYQGRYNKMHLVIFGEYLPLKNYVPLLARFTPFSSEFGIMAGTEPSVFEYAGARFSPTICYEDTVPHLIREIARSASESDRPIDYFVNHSNDGWFAGSSEQDQHLVTSLFRCIETRTPMVRAVNTGVSAFIDGNGVIREPHVLLDATGKHREFCTESGNWTKDFAGVLIDNVLLDSRGSVYLLVGDVLAGGCGAACVFLTGAWAISAVKS